MADKATEKATAAAEDATLSTTREDDSETIFSMQSSSHHSPLVGVDGVSGEAGDLSHLLQQANDDHQHQSFDEDDSILGGCCLDLSAEELALDRGLESILHQQRGGGGAPSAMRQEDDDDCWTKRLHALSLEDNPNQIATPTPPEEEVCESHVMAQGRQMTKIEGDFSHLLELAGHHQGYRPEEDCSMGGCFDDLSPEDLALVLSVHGGKPEKDGIKSVSFDIDGGSNDRDDNNHQHPNRISVHGDMDNSMKELVGGHLDNIDKGMDMMQENVERFVHDRMTTFGRNVQRLFGLQKPKQQQPQQATTTTAALQIDQF